MLTSLFIDFPELAHLPDAFIVGGAVRDLLLGERPDDVDLACVGAEAAARGVAKRLGRKLIPLGGDRFGAFRIVANGATYDFAELTGGSIEIDLARRDFTINAMAFGLRQGTLLDPFGGQTDLKDRIVRMVSTKNFDDDPLRTLRGVRMAARRRFAIEPTTLAAIRERAGRIADVAAERVTSELLAILAAPPPERAIALLHEARFDEVLFGELLEPHRFARIAAEGIDAVTVAFAMILRDAGAVNRFAERWRWSEALRRDVLALLGFAADASGAPLRLRAYDAGEATSRRAVALLRAIEREDEAAALEAELHAHRPLFDLVPLLTGKEIAAASARPPGPDIGALKRLLIEAQLAGAIADRESAERFIRAQSARL